MTSASTPPTAATERAEWFRQLVAGTARRANRPGEFTIYEVAQTEQLAEPPCSQWWGTGTGIARQQGLIHPVAATPSRRPRTAKSLVRMWIGRKFAEGGEDE